MKNQTSTKKIHKTDTGKKIVIKSIFIGDKKAIETISELAFFHVKSLKNNR